MLLLIIFNKETEKIAFCLIRSDNHTECLIATNTFRDFRFQGAFYCNPRIWDKISKTYIFNCHKLERNKSTINYPQLLLSAISLLFRNYFPTKSLKSNLLLASFNIFSHCSEKKKMVFKVATNDPYACIFLFRRKSD